jgi:hypothetical protein
MSETSLPERAGTRAEGRGTRPGPLEERDMSEGEGSQPERGVTRAEPAEGRGRVRSRSGR